MFTVLLLDSGQCLFGLRQCRYTDTCIAHTLAEMAAETSSGPDDIDIE